MHFSFHDATKKQIPNFISGEYMIDMIVVVTGMLEVSTGILILVRETRRWAALSSLILILLFIPAVYHILANDSALTGPPAWKVFFRLLLLPNNILLAICSIHLFQNPSASSIGVAQSLDNVIAHLFQNPSASSIGVAQSLDKAVARSNSTSNERATLLVAFLLLASNCAGFLVILTSVIQDKSTAYLWAMMCIATGALIGFLFGVPRVNADTFKSSDLAPNSNIELVSDWLTKILIGVGLINIREIGGLIDGIADDLSGSISLPTGKPFAIALIAYFFVIGLIQGYLLTRMFLSWHFFAQMQSFRSKPENKVSDQAAAQSILDLDKRS